MELLEPLYEQLETMWVGFMQLLPLLGIAFVVLFCTWIIAKIVSKILKSSLDHSSIRPSLKELFGTLAKVGVWTLGILVATTIIFPSLTPAKMLAALGLGSVAIGFAFKDIFENFLAGVLIMLREPMRIGDFIECEDVEGWVEKISIRETYIRQPDQQLILVPNAHLFQNPVYIRTDKDIRRFEIVAGVGYGENVDECRDIIKKAVEGVDGLHADKPVQVFAREFNSSSIDYTVRWWCGSKPIDMHESRDKVISAIKAALDKEGVEIPFPYRTLTFSEPLKIEGLNDKNEGSDDKPEKQKQQAQT